MIKIKICGIKTEKHALGIAEAGADFIGLNFANSPRQVTPARAKKIVAALRKSGKDIPETVGIFVNTPVYMVNRVSGLCCLDWVQLSGNENIDYCREITLPVFKVIRVSRHYQPEQVCRDLAAWSEVLSKREHRFLLDSFDTYRYGGTGKQIDRETIKGVCAKFPVIIAGGLTPENVAEVVTTARPWGIDVSSGVETGGEKDMKKIRAFIKAARNADADQA